MIAVELWQNCTIRELTHTSILSTSLDLGTCIMQSQYVPINSACFTLLCKPVCYDKIV